MKNMLNAFRAGIISGLHAWKIGGWIYGMQLVLAIIFGRQVHQVLSQTLGNSLALQSLGKGFDYMVIMDLLRNEGGQFSKLVGALWWVILIYLVIGVFLQAGAIVAMKKKKYHLSWYRSNCRVYFLPFLKMALWFWFLLILWTLMLWVPFFANVFNMLRELPDERSLLGYLAGIGFFYFLGGIFLFIWSINARLRYVDHPESWTKAIGEGRKLLAQKWLTQLVITFLFILLLVLIITIKSGLGKLDASTNALLVATFIIGQFFFLGRILIRLMTYGAFAALHERKRYVPTAE